MTTSWSCARVGQAADERAVDLQVAKGQVLEVVEGAEARAEVVERDRAAECLRTGAEGPRALHVGDRSRLGDLEDQARGVDAVAVEPALDVGEHVAVGDRQRGEVHRDRTAACGLGACGAEQRGDLVEHHPVDLADQAVALGRRQEAGRARSGRRRRSSARRTSASWCATRPSASETIGW